jgi:hypothetical protein
MNFTLGPKYFSDLGPRKNPLTDELLEEVQFPDLGGTEVPVFLEPLDSVEDVLLEVEDGPLPGGRRFTRRVEEVVGERGVRGIRTPTLVHLTWVGKETRVLVNYQLTGESTFLRPLEVDEETVPFDELADVFHGLTLSLRD